MDLKQLFIALTSLLVCQKILTSGFLILTAALPFLLLAYWPLLRDITLPILTCPSDKVVLADPFQTNCRVYWTEPTAVDKLRKHVSVRQIKGKPSGRTFVENDDPIVYEAKDKRGNRNNCTMKITVKVVRCTQPSPIANGYFICHPSTEFVRGGWCEYGCYDGFDIVGESRRKCQDDGTWSFPVPKCSAWKCPVLPAIEGAGLPECTKAELFTSICTYSCRKRGYDMPYGAGSTYVCALDKTWKYSGYTKCVDVESPVFDTCPGTVMTGTDNNSTSSIVTWEEPTASDNSGKSVNVVLKSKPYGPNAAIPPGQYQIIYGATDQSGNTGIDCSFDVVVREMKCPRIYPTPFLRVSCPHGVRTGTTCNLACEPGKELVGNETVLCDRSTLGLYGEWNWLNNAQYFCNFTKECPDINPPRKGAIVCAYWMGGRICQALCQDKTAMPGVDLNILYNCDGTGQWIPSPFLKPCQDIQTTRHIHKRSAIEISTTYFGVCPNERTKKMIMAVFNSQLMNYQLNDGNPRTHSDFKIYCGDTHRRKRSSNLTQTEEQKQLSDVTIRFNLYITTSVNDSIYEIANRYHYSIEILKEIVKLHKEDIFGNQTTTEIEVQGNGMETLCDPGSVPSEDVLSCVTCPVGTYYTSDTVRRKPACEQCRKGFYQDTTGQTYCKQCPTGTTTEYLGTEELLQCEVACLPGSYSFNGLHPCSPCDLGFYQPSYGETFCTRCPGSSTTETFGQSSSTSCKEFDVRFAETNESRIFLRLNKYKLIDDFTISVWSKNICTKNCSLTIRFSNQDQREQFNISICDGLNRSSQLNSATDFHSAVWRNFVIQSQNCSTTIFVDRLHLATNLPTKTCRQFNLSNIYIFKEGSGKAYLSQFNVWKGHTDVINERRCFLVRTKGTSLDGKNLTILFFMEQSLKLQANVMTTMAVWQTHVYTEAVLMI